jgi:hypothetical protein
MQAPLVAKPRSTRRNALVVVAVVAVAGFAAATSAKQSPAVVAASKSLAAIRKPDGAKCNKDDECQSGDCHKGAGKDQNKCKPHSHKLPNGATCHNDEQCQSGDCHKGAGPDKNKCKISAVASTSMCDTPTSGQTCSKVAPGGFVEGHKYTPCYCSPTEGTYKVTVDVLGCLGKCDAGHQCPHVIPSFVHDTGHAAGWPYPHVSIIVDGGVEVDIKKFKAVLRDAAHKGGSTNWWKPDLAKAKITSYPLIRLRGTVSRCCLKRRRELKVN